MREETARAAAVELVRRVQEMPYVWPCPPDAEWARRNQAGSCASKHAFLAEELERIGIASAPLLVVGALVPETLSQEPEFAQAARLPEVHEFLTLLTPWAGPLRVDVTWDPPLVHRGLPGTLDWDGTSDMAVAVGEGGGCWAVERSTLRAAKEALRARLYRDDERAIRDEALRRLVERFEAWRG